MRSRRGGMSIAFGQAGDSLSTAGSPARVPCPTCRSSDVKIALNAGDVTYFVCLACHHGWAKPERRQRDQPHVPERRQEAGKSLCDTTPDDTVEWSSGS